MTTSTSRFTRSRWLILAAFTPLLITGPAANAQSSCQDECLATYEACSRDCLGGNFYGCEETCQNNLGICLQTCPSCPTTRTYTQTSILGSQLNFFQEGCFNTRWNNTIPRAFENYTVQYRQQTFRETTACNGSKSTVLIGDSTFSDICWKRPVFDRACRLGVPIGSFGSAVPVCPF